MTSIGWIFGLALVAAPVQARDFSDPTWPCVQRKVETLSIGLMWTHPLPDTPVDDPETRHEIDRLAAKMALRRIEVESLRPEIEAFAARHEGSPAMLGRVFRDLFETLARRRAKVVSGIEEFSQGQIELSARIDAARTEMDAALEAEPPDHDRIDALEEQLDWDQTIYTDRQSTIKYLCETPTLIEQRLYALARMLRQQMREAG